MQMDMNKKKEEQQMKRREAESKDCTFKPKTNER